MRFEDFHGVDELIGRLKRETGSGDPVHAYLFCGPVGSSKRSLARICARALNCYSDGEKPCDLCGSCRRYLAGTHPDHMELSDQKIIKVDQVRDVIQWLATRSFEGGRKTVLFGNADAMNVQAQNALLKTLEDPPRDVVIFLTAEKPTSLLPTVLSRVRMMRFSPLSQSGCARALEKLGIEGARAEQLAEVAQGSVGVALKLDRDEGFWRMREQVLEALEGIRGPGDVFRAAEGLKAYKGADVRRVLDMMEQIACAKMEGEETGRHSGYERIGLPGCGLLEAVMEARRMVERNVNWQYALETLLFSGLRAAGLRE